eukprot:TRINITY_DN10072_c0_g1_i1.p1 TRINITY_DN10072_c0_g1~~TRINITY_DN10072_c0_g1_i1.p1  ORF type:complete len:2057 (+),score=467.34 TRINITY_DN10072_c0_g1_i1:166-6336(+)
MSDDQNDKRKSRKRKHDQIEPDAPASTASDSAPVSDDLLNIADIRPSRFANVSGIDQVRKLAIEDRHDRIAELLQKHELLLKELSFLDNSKREYATFDPTDPHLIAGAEVFRASVAYQIFPRSDKLKAAFSGPALAPTPSTPVAVKSEKSRPTTPVAPPSPLTPTASSSSQMTSIRPNTNLVVPGVNGVPPMSPAASAGAPGSAPKRKNKPHPPPQVSDAFPNVVVHVEPPNYVEVASSLPVKKPKKPKKPKAEKKAPTPFAGGDAAEVDTTPKAPTMMSPLLTANYANISIRNANVAGVKKKGNLFPFSEGELLSVTATHPSILEAVDVTLLPRAQDRAKTDAATFRRISELSRAGQLSAKRIPKPAEPPRTTAHWDYVLKEMAIMAVDYREERKWKMAACKKTARLVQKWHQDKWRDQLRQRREAEASKRELARWITRQVRNWWREVEEFIKLRHQNVLEEKKKQAMDKHLDFLVGQTEKYSEMLAKDLATNPPPTAAVTPSATPAQIEEVEDKMEVDEEEPVVAIPTVSDLMSAEDAEEDAADFDPAAQPGGNDDMDDEETMAQAEQMLDTKNSDIVSAQEEADLLKKESEMPVEKLLEKYNIPESDQALTASTGGGAADSDDEYEEDSDSDVPDAGADNADGKERIELAAQAAQAAQPTGFTLATSHVKTPIPSLLRAKLREYQHIGLDWLVTMYEKKLNGILADEMGLGKTIMTISMLAHLACKEGIWGPHLIIVPSSVLLNWEMELKRFCPAFKILTYFGSQKQRRQKRQGWTKPNSFHVCLTSYKLAIQDQHTFKRKKWFYMILDEAHNIKNYQSQRWQTLLNYRSKRRLLLTGTPLQNDLMELWSLMHFLMPHVFQSHKEFKEWFSKPVTSMVEGTTAQNDQLVQRLHSILRPFMLRRLKKDVEKQLPDKFEHVVYCKLSKRQRFLYDEYMSSTNTQATLRGGTYLGIANVLMQLRKVCNHPDLFESRPIVSPFDQGKITYHVPSLALRALDYDPHKDVSLSFFNLSNLPALSRRQTHLSVIESRSLKPSIEEIRYAASQGTYRPSITPAPERQIVARSGGRLPAPRKQQLPSGRNVTRVSNVLRPAIRIPRDVFFDPYLNEQLGVSEASGAAGQQHGQNAPPPTLSSPRERRAPKPMGGGQLTRSNYFDSLKQQQRQRLLQEATARADQLVYINEIRHDRVPFIGYDTIRVCKMDHPVYDIGKIASNPLRIEEYPRALADAVVSYEQRAEEMKDTIAHFACIIPAVRAPAVELHASHPTPSEVNRKRLDVLKLKQRVALPEKTQLLHNAQMRLSVYFPDKRLVQFDCGKLQQLDLLLRELKRGGHRALIFTQMTRMLDVLEAFLNIHGHTYLRLDGAVKVEQRQKMMERFNNDNKVFLFILTTRTGGIGINLTGADTVIFYDSDWNPAMDAQAQDRCHRIGQTREVHIYRLISEHTIEENILKKARQKLQLDQIIKDGKFTTEFFHRVDIRDFITDARKTLEGGPAAEDEAALPNMSDKDLEQALMDAEDETDRIALRQVRAEQAQETEEFNENASSNPLAASTGSAGAGEIDDPVLMGLSSVQRYAVRFVEEVNPVIDKDELELQHRQVEADEQVWQQDALKRIQEGQESSDDEGVIVTVPAASPQTPRSRVRPPPSPSSSSAAAAVPGKLDFIDETPRVAAAAFAAPEFASPAPAVPAADSPVVSPRSSRRKPGRPPKTKRGARGAAAAAASTGAASASEIEIEDDDEPQLYYEVISNYDEMTREYGPEGEIVRPGRTPIKDILYGTLQLEEDEMEDAEEDYSALTLFDEDTEELVDGEILSGGVPASALPQEIWGMMFPDRDELYIPVADDMNAFYAVTRELGLLEQQAHTIEAKLNEFLQKSSKKKIDKMTIANLEEQRRKIRKTDPAEQADTKQKKPDLALLVSKTEEVAKNFGYDRTPPTVFEQAEPTFVYASSGLSDNPKHRIIADWRPEEDKAIEESIARFGTNFGLAWQAVFEVSPYSSVSPRTPSQVFGRWKEFLLPRMLAAEEKTDQPPSGTAKKICCSVVGKNVFAEAIQTFGNA